MNKALTRILGTSVLAAGLVGAAFAAPADLQYTSFLPWFNIEVAPDNAHVVTSGPAGGAVLRRLSDGGAVRQFAVPNVPTAATVRGTSISPDMSLIAVANQTVNGVQVFDYNTGDLVTTIAVPATSRGVAFSPDGTKLAVSHWTPLSAVRVYNVGSWGAPVWENNVDFPGTNAQFLSWSPDGNTVAVGNNDGRVRGLSAVDGSLTWITDIADSHTGTVFTVRWVDNTNLVSSGLVPDSTIRRWTVSGSTVSLNGSPIGLNGGSTTFSFNSDKSLIVTVAGTDIQVVNRVSGAILATYPVTTMTAVNGVSFAPGDMTYMVLGTSSAATVPENARPSALEFYNATTGGYVGEFAGHGLGGGRGLAISPDNQFIVSGTWFGAPTFNFVSCISLTDQSLKWVYHIPEAGRTALGFAYSPDGSHIAVSTGFASAAQMLILKANTGAVVTTFPIDFASAEFYVNWYQDGANTRIAVAGNSGIVRVYNPDGTLYSSSPAGLVGLGGIWSLDRSPIANQIAVGTSEAGNHRVYILNVVPGENNMTIAGSSSVMSAAVSIVRYSPDGLRIAAGHALAAGVAEVRTFNDLSDLSVSTVLGTNHTNTVTGIAWLPDNVRFGSFAADGAGVNSQIRFWDSNAAGEIGTLTGRMFTGGSSRDLMLTPNGTGFAFMGQNGPSIVDNPYAGAVAKSTIMWEGPDSGPLPRLMVGWRTENGSVVLPVVVVDIAPATWEVRAFGQIAGGPTDDLIWQNTDPGFSIPGLVAFWEVQPDGTPLPAGTGGQPPAFSWQIRGAADFDGNGVTDLLWFNTADGMVAIWLRDENGDVIGTPIVGSAAAGFELRGSGSVTGGPTQDLMFQNASGDVYIWTLDGSFAVSGSIFVGDSGADWRLVGVGSFNSAGDPGLLFYNTANRLVAFWNLDSSGAVTGTGVIGEGPVDWKILGTSNL
ncbi:MAG: WD40 repeat domain-containing protein [Fimbriimonadaceae bacterium]